MSNHGDPWRKFVQTFFLAEQPNGYFVLNDIFRFLKEETVEGDDVSEPDAEPSSPVPAEAPVPASAPEAVVEDVAPPPVATPEPAPPAVEEPPTTVIPEPIAPTLAVELAPQKVNGNGVHAATPEPEIAPELPASESRASTPEPATVATPPTPAPLALIPAPPVAAAPAPPVTTPAPAPAQPAAPPAPKTWANLAATNSKKWGSAVAQESRGVTSVPASPAPTTTPLASVSAPSGPHHQPPHPNGPPRNMNNGNPHPVLLAAQTVATAQCFVKGVTEPITQTILTQVLTARFGPIKDQAEIVRTKACAFLEFQTVDAARKAIIASLPVGLGGEGGIKIDVAGETLRINVETRKERGDRPPSRPRGGAPVNGGERGSFRGGRGGPGGRGRGGPAPAAK